MLSFKKTRALKTEVRKKISGWVLSCKLFFLMKRKSSGNPTSSIRNFSLLMWIYGPCGSRKTQGLEGATGYCLSLSAAKAGRNNLSK
jgi:hypothetical protein